MFNPGQRNNVCEKLCLHHPAGGVWAQNYHPTGGIWGQDAPCVQTRGRLVAGHLPNQVWGNKGQQVRSPAVRMGRSEPGQAQGLGQEGREGTGPSAITDNVWFVVEVFKSPWSVSCLPLPWPVRWSSFPSPRGLSIAEGAVEEDALGSAFRLCH